MTFEFAAKASISRSSRRKSPRDAGLPGPLAGILAVVLLFLGVTTAGRCGDLDDYVRQVEGLRECLSTGRQPSPIASAPARGWSHRPLVRTVNRALSAADLDRPEALEQADAILRLALEEAQRLQSRSREVNGGGRDVAGSDLDPLAVALDEQRAMDRKVPLGKPMAVVSLLLEKLGPLLAPIRRLLSLFRDSPFGTAMSLLVWAACAIAMLLAMFTLLALVRASWQMLRLGSDTPLAPEGGHAAAPSLNEERASAETCARDGDFLGALRHLHQAALLALEGKGAVLLQPGFSNTRYCRVLSRNPTLLGPFRQLCAALNRHFFGGVALDEATFAGYADLARPLLDPRKGTSP